MEACQQGAAVPGHHHHLFAAPDFDLVSQGQELFLPDPKGEDHGLAVQHMTGLAGLSFHEMHYEEDQKRSFCIVIKQVQYLEPVF